MKKILIPALALVVTACNASATPLEIISAETSVTPQGYYRIESEIKLSPQLNCQQQLVMIMEISDQQEKLGQFVAIANIRAKNTQTQTVSAIGVLEQPPPREPQNLTILHYECK